MARAKTRPSRLGALNERPVGEPGAERRRLAEARDNAAVWYKWGSYLSERQWGTVREDYSPSGAAWDFFPHEHARSRVYRWGEDGLLGISDDRGRLCFALALWNETDPILKERLFGLTGTEGNHGEDVKEYYFYLDATPTHSYMKALYKYPQRAFPYALLAEENRLRGRSAPEFELADTGVFAESRYFDIVVEYAKADPEDLLIRISATNRGPDAAPLHLLPTLWFRNTWAWGQQHEKTATIEQRPALRAVSSHGMGPTGMDMGETFSLVQATHPELGEYWLAAQGAAELLFTENESNAERLWGVPNAAPYVKDGINDAIVGRARERVNPEQVGTKVAAHYPLSIAPGATATVVLRFCKQRQAAPFAEADALFVQRQSEADAFYLDCGGQHMSEDERRVQRQAFAGLLWSKQFYSFDIEQWLDGDPTTPKPPAERTHGRNHDWRHLNTADLLSMPDKWEYPWFAAWDLAFHCIPLAQIDPEFAKRQLLLLMREWYMHPNGQLPAYEWAFGDVNPPVHAWAAWRVYQIERRITGQADRAFLERVFHKLLLNFNWWVNRKDSDGHNVFQGGFLGLDNIGVFDRSSMIPGGGHLEQSDGTAWMGMYCLNMLKIALELAREEPIYQDIASKFFEHFLYIAGALNNLGGDDVSLWDESDEFYYDVLHLPDDTYHRLKVRSLVGLIPLLAVEVIEPELLDAAPEFEQRLEWMLEHRPRLASLISRWHVTGLRERRLLALVRGHRMKRLLARMLDPNEFLGDYGIRALSKYHHEHPYRLSCSGAEYTVRYEPAESSTGLFGGNSNWRGPIWFPINYLLIEALQRFHHYYGDDFLVECPTGSGQKRTIAEIASELSRRLIRIFLNGEDGRRPVFGGNDLFQRDPAWHDNLLYYEYFHGDNGAGIGASHQTGWTALVAKLLEQQKSVQNEAH
jgi:hypothetical protein